jgi:hypothetical protein
MRWQDSRKSDNVEDYRGQRFGGTGLRLGVGGTLVALVAGYFLGIDPRVILGLVQNVPVTEQQGQPMSGTPSDEEGQFIAAVLGETEDTWTAIFQAAGATYTPPKLALYSGQISSACGFASAAAGPFYCPGDRKVYLDLEFFDELSTQFKAPGDFARAYVIAHEVGHHVQLLLGTEAKLRAAQERASPAERNQLQVSMELQADCFAGVWAKHTDQARHILEQGDLDSALHAAAAVGDDTIQKRTQGYVVPDSFTHGTAQQRTHWFQTGFETGSIQACDTFANAGAI